MRMNEFQPPTIVPALERATHAVALWVERSFADLRLTQAEAHVLAFLAEHAPCSINDLHRGFGHKRSTLTSLLDRLEGRGWIERAAHPASRRLVLVRLTEPGQGVADRVLTALRGLERRVLARARPGATDAFARVLAALEEELSHA